MRRTNPDFMTAVKAQANTNAVFKLESRAQLLFFHFGLGEQGHADPRFDIRFHRFTGKLVHKDR